MFLFMQFQKNPDMQRRYHDFFLIFGIFGSHGTIRFITSLNLNKIMKFQNLDKFEVIKFSYNKKKQPRLCRVGAARKAHTTYREVLML